MLASYIHIVSTSTHNFSTLLFSTHGRSPDASSAASLVSCYGINMAVGVAFSALFFADDCVNSANASADQAPPEPQRT